MIIEDFLVAYLLKEKVIVFFTKNPVSKRTVNIIKTNHAEPEYQGFTLEFLRFAKIITQLSVTMNFWVKPVCMVFQIAEHSCERAGTIPRRHRTRNVSRRAVRAGAGTYVALSWHIAFSKMPTRAGTLGTGTGCSYAAESEYEHDFFKET